ncbi:hypothetical protein CR513_33982, partial [Mucuna pruriens]
MFSSNRFLWAGHGGKTSGKGCTLILGRPFLMTARTKIDVYAGTLSMEFGDNLVQFNIFKAMKHPLEDHSLCNIDMIEELVEEFTQLDSDSDNMSPFVEISNMFPCTSSIKKEDNFTNKTPRPITDLLPLESPPDYKLKPLSDRLTYVYLDNNQHSLMIIANNLYQEQEEKLLKVLQQHKKEIRRLHLTILDVVKKEVTKLLAPGIIYPILDSNWVSLVQVMPKKSRMIVTKNQHAEMDHFPFPFIDQVLEKLAEKSHYYLDGYSGYMQIHISPEDQHKTTFTCPFGTFTYTKISFGLYNALSTFQRCLLSIFSDQLEECMKAFMDDFTMYADTFDACLENLSRMH